jgi:hypothetical protein
VFLTRDHNFGRPQRTQLPQRDSPFLKKGRVPLRPFTRRPIASLRNSRALRFIKLINSLERLGDAW